jgi:hypothetical protein
VSGAVEESGYSREKEKKKKVLWFVEVCYTKKKDKDRRRTREHLYLFGFSFKPMKRQPDKRDEEAIWDTDLDLNRGNQKKRLSNNYVEKKNSRVCGTRDEQLS